MTINRKKADEWREGMKKCCVVITHHKRQNTNEYAFHAQKRNIKISVFWFYSQTRDFASQFEWKIRLKEKRIEIQKYTKFFCRLNFINAIRVQDKNSKKKSFFCSACNNVIAFSHLNEIEQNVKRKFIFVFIYFLCSFFSFFLLRQQ